MLQLVLLRGRPILFQADDPLCRSIDGFGPLAMYLFVGKPQKVGPDQAETLPIALVQFVRTQRLMVMHCGCHPLCRSGWFELRPGRLERRKSPRLLFMQLCLIFELCSERRCEQRTTCEPLSGSARIRISYRNEGLRGLSCVLFSETKVGD